MRLPRRQDQFYAAPVPIRVNLLLADFAQVAENKLYIVGGGWDIIGPQIGPSAVGMIIHVSWDLTNRKHTWRLELVDSDGEPVVVETPMGSDEPVAVNGEFEVGRPPGVTPGASLNVPVAINFGPLPLEPGRRYEWRLTIGEESDERWRLPFTVRAAS